MNTFISAPLGTHALRTSTFDALLLGLVVTAPAYGQDSQRDRMVALHDANSAHNPPPVEHSTRLLATGTELLQDGKFEAGYYGTGLTSGTHGVTGYSRSSFGGWGGSVPLVLSKGMNDINIPIL